VSTLRGPVPDRTTDRHGVRTVVCAPDGPALRSDRDVTDLIGHALADGAELVAIPARRLGDGFFTLRTGVAGQVVQKFVNYGLRLAIVGDICAYLERSSALRDYVAESNRGHHVWFVPDLAALDARLARAAPDPGGYAPAARDRPTGRGER
jgi:hypothetical protein